jgi:hypothetical protein
MDYPSESRVESALRRLASESGDDTADPFRVALLKIHGGQPPRYTVVVVSPQQLLLRERLGSVVGRSFSLGVRSFLLARASPAARALIVCTSMSVDAPNAGHSDCVSRRQTTNLAEIC